MKLNKKAARQTFPVVVKRGSCIVKIYRDRKLARTYYRVCYHVGGKRQRLNFSDLSEAKLEAQSQASKLSRGDVDALQLTGKDRLIYGRALEAVRATGLPLDAAALEFCEARKHLKGVSLTDAAKFFARHHAQAITAKSVAEGIDEMIAAKKRSGLSELYLADLRYRLGVFKTAFHCDLNLLTSGDISKFFEGLQLSPRSFNNFLRTIRTFFGFAQKRGWIAPGIDLLSRIERRREVSSPVEIFTSSELVELLARANSTLQVGLALAAFAGLRSEEVLRLEWTDIDRRPGFVEIAAAKAKTQTRRLVPISDNLSAWLAVTPRAAARVWPHSKAWFFESMREAVGAVNVMREKAAGRRFSPFRWKKNGLRHSFITYRLAHVQDVNRVALEAGNSPQMIFRHYRELATPEEAGRWFSVNPPATRIV